MKRTVIALCQTMMACIIGAAHLATADEPESRIRFERVENTGLDRILRERRALLEERKGAPLKGHEWWLWGLSAFDYDRDGDLDLIVCVHGSTNGLIVRNERSQHGRIEFVDVTQALGVDGAVPSTDDYPLIWDFDGDGFLDVAGLFDDRSTPCLWNRDGRSFEKASFSLHPLNHARAVEDLDGDGDLDVWQIRRDRRVELLYDTGSRSFEKRETDFTPPVELPASVEQELDVRRADPKNRFLMFQFVERDLNGDGRRDLVITGFGAYSGDRVGWYLVQDDDGKFSDRTRELGLPRDGAPFSIEDLDNDGDIDLLIASSENGGLYLNSGEGRFTRTPGAVTDFVRRRCPYLHVVFRVDLDNDGDRDLAISNRRLGRQKFYENLGDGRFAEVFSARGWDADPLVLGDFDGDGLVDLVIGGSEEKEDIGVYRNATPHPGNFCSLLPRMTRPNVYAAGTIVEAFPAGTIDIKGSRPFLVERTRPDGSPVHIGLGAAKLFDLRITFPGREPVVHRELEARPALVVTPDGISHGNATSSRTPDVR